MKPHVICLMTSRVDGWILPSPWPPTRGVGNVFERAHGELAGDAWRGFAAGAVMKLRHGSPKHGRRLDRGRAGARWGELKSSQTCSISRCFFPNRRRRSVEPTLTVSE
jgi:hypothetical protein